MLLKVPTQFYTLCLKFLYDYLKKSNKKIYNFFYYETMSMKNIIDYLVVAYEYFFKSIFVNF